MSKSNRPRRRRKAVAGRPPKPYLDFPLSPHAAGSWCKKIRGKIHYFGKWGRVVKGKMVRLPGDGWQAALEQYKAQKDDLYAGRTPRVKDQEGLTVRDLCNRFLTAKQRKRDAGEITDRTFAEYRKTTDQLVRQLGKDRLVDDLAVDDFEALRAEMAKTCGPVRLGNEIQRVRTVFKYAFEAGLIEKPVRFGGEFKRPAKSVLRRHKATKGSKLFEAAEIRAMLDSAAPQLRAMILLGINAGFGNADCGKLPLSAVDLEKGWIRFPRPKTGIERRCPLWPETIEALQVALADRSKPNSEAHTNLVFITKYGESWAKDTPDSPVTKETRKLLDELGIHRPGLGFYSLRHTHRTIADTTRDFPAVRLIMGHADQSIDDVYRERIEDSRLLAVSDHLRRWLWPATATASKNPVRKSTRRKPNKPKRGKCVIERPKLRVFGG